MNIQLIAVGSKMPDWVNIAVAEYQKRFPSHIQFSITEIPLNKRGKNADIPRLMAKESELMLAAIGQSDRVIALDVQGKSFSSQQVAEQLRHWIDHNQSMSLLVGGPEGLTASCLQRADQRWSLSDLTLPHPLVRIIVAETLYRAWSIISGHPYHR